jgi:diamine N-acetyltransferase
MCITGGTLNIPIVAARPSFLTRYMSQQSGHKLIFRPLEGNDVQGLREFLESLSDGTRLVWRRDRYDLAEAQDLCDAVGRYDKLRMVIEEVDQHKVLGLFEFSFDIPESDRQRFAAYGIELNELTDCRFGPCVRDEFQGVGLASAAMPLIKEVSTLFGRSRIILWGGVLEANERATRFYQKHGFQTVGRFLNADGQPSLLSGAKCRD